MGNSQDFGDTSAAVRGHATLASSTRAVSASGYVAPANVNTIEFSPLQHNQIQLILVT